MRINEIELSAAKNQPLPTYLTAPETCLYASLRALYQQYRNGSIAKDQVKTEKSKIISKCEYYEAENIAWQAAAKYYQTNIRKCGTLRSKIEKSNDIKHIAMIACEIIGLMTGDDGFLKRQAGKF